MIKRYIFVDPFCLSNSGVTNYINASINLFPNNEFIPEKFDIEIGENLDSFRTRLKIYVESLSPSDVIIESPETLFTTKLINDKYKLHIRLHGSREFGKLIQKFPVSEDNCRNEIKEIKRAFIVSAPSLAALKSSEFLYKKSINAVIYPNPVDFNANLIFSKNRDIDVLFLGRWHDLKGVRFIEFLINNNKNIKFLVTSNDISKVFVNCEKLKLSRVDDKFELLGRTKVVIIPSLFETASQVALEAISCGAKVVAWSHIGFFEYINSVSVKKINPWDLNEFSQGIRSMLEFKSVDENLIDQVQSINKHYLIGLNFVFKSIDSHNCVNSINLMPNNIEYKFDLKAIFSDEVIMVKDKNIIFKRKLKKLFRNPYLFFKDAFNKKSRKIEVRNKISHSSTEKKRSSKEEASFAEIPGTIVENIKNIVNISSNKNIGHLNNFLANIDLKQNIKFNQPNSKAKGWVTCIFFPEKYFDYAKVLGSRLNEFEDFSPFKYENLNYVQFPSFCDFNSLDLINKIDINNKDKISQINFAFFINPDVNFLEAIRSSAESLKTIVFLTREFQISKELIDKYIEFTDAFLIFDNNNNIDCIKEKSRRCNIIKSYGQVKDYTRKIVQEIGPKKIDYLLPILNCDFDPKYIDFDVFRYQGVVKLKNHNYDFNMISGDFKEALNLFSEKIDLLMVSETVYMRYRTQCEIIENGGSSARFFEFALKDGFLFYVH